MHTTQPVLHTVHCQNRHHVTYRNSVATNIISWMCYIYHEKERQFTTGEVLLVVFKAAAGGDINSWRKRYHIQQVSGMYSNTVVLFTPLAGCVI